MLLEQEAARERAERRAEHPSSIGAATVLQCMFRIRSSIVEFRVHQIRRASSQLGSGGQTTQPREIVRVKKLARARMLSVGALQDGFHRKELKKDFTMVNAALVGMKIRSMGGFRTHSIQVLHRGHTRGAFDSYSQL